MQRQEHQKTAVLVFALSANEEVNHKAIKKGEILFNALTADTLRKVKCTNLPYFHITEQQQDGDSFGERFANAIQTVFEFGFTRIITIGNDSPQLKSNHIRKAANALAKGKNVLGPSTDGGFYLMGLRQEHFKKDSFVALPWQTQRLFQATQHHFCELNEDTLRLASLSDVDSMSDVKQLLINVKSLAAELRLLILHLFNRLDRVFFGQKNILQSNYHSLSNLVRGSP